MIKIDIADLLVKKSSIQKMPITRGIAIQAVDLITDRISMALLSGNRVEFRGFGVFEPRTRKTGVGRNVKTGASVNIPKGHSVRFKPGTSLRDVEIKTKS